MPIIFYTLALKDALVRAYIMDLVLVRFGFYLYRWVWLLLDSIRVRRLIMIWFESFGTDYNWFRSCGSSEFQFESDILLWVILYIIYVYSRYFPLYPIWNQHMPLIVIHYCWFDPGNLTLVIIHWCRFKLDAYLNGYYGFLGLIQLWIIYVFSFYFYVSHRHMRARWVNCLLQCA